MKGPMLYGAIIVSVYVMTGFTALSVLMFARVIPADMKEVALVVLGAWSAMATGIAGFWTGSSIGSMQKSAILQRRGEEVRRRVPRGVDPDAD